MLSVVLSHHRLIITFVGSHSPEDDWQGYLYAVVIFVVAVIQSICLHQYFIRVMVVGMRLRTAVMSIVYKKVGRGCGGHAHYSYHLLSTCSSFISYVCIDILIVTCNTCSTAESKLLYCMMRA